MGRAAAGVLGAWIALAPSWPAPAEAARIGGVSAVSGGPVLDFVVEGPFVVKQYRLSHPGRLVVDFHHAAYAGQPVTVGAVPGTTLAGGKLFQLGNGTVRAFFELAEPSLLECRFVPLGAARTRVEFVLPAMARVAGGGPVPGIPAVPPEGPQIPPFTARVPRGLVFPLGRTREAPARTPPTAPLAAAAGRLAGAASLLSGLRQAARKPAQRAELAGARPRAPWDAAVGPGSGATAARVANLELPGRLARPLEHVLPPLSRAWERTPLLARALARPIAAARAFGSPWHAPGFDPAWQWRTSSQVLYTSNTAPFEGGTPAWGTRHRLTGFFYQEEPVLRGFAVAHVDQQAMRFTDPRLDYQSLLGTLAFTHPILPHLHVFEGGAAQDREPTNVGDYALVDTSLYAGLGAFGDFGPDAAWGATLTAERVAAASLRESYYGQSLRLLYLNTFGHSAVVRGQATVQRIDPVVRTIPFVRGYLEASVERVVGAGMHLGLQAQLGVQQTATMRDAFVVGGPYMQVSF